MKRLIVFVLIVLVLCGINLSFTSSLTLNKLFSGAVVEVYLQNQDYVGECKTVKNGDGLIVITNVNELNYILKNYKTNGFTLKINNLSLNKTLAKLNPNYYKTKNNYTYGYLSYGALGVCVGQDVVNFQCCEVGGEVLVGFPILLGSY